jgi:hypothetical protein
MLLQYCSALTKETMYYKIKKREAFQKFSELL